MSRIRSPRYPNHNLEETIDFIGKIHAEDRQHPVSREVAARHMGFSGISGTSDRALASLMHYGLAEKAVKGELRVSDLALSIMHPHSEKERVRALFDAGFHPELFKELHDRYPDQPPSAVSLESYLSRSGFAPAAIRPASKAYLETCQFLQRNGAYESDGSLMQEGSESADIIEHAEQKPVDMSPKIVTPAQGVPVAPVVRGDIFVLSGGGEVIANLPETMSSRDYEDLKDWLELMIRKAGRKVVSEPAPSISIQKSSNDEESETS
jgi:hypothetical protein